ncbi:hypothetical protein ACLQ3C_18725 [Gordonia sp. DT30]|uniref:hypothetical protein n=1 Tax=unclassified Gordonia (in: high G+C Gram-positive bacteria) TaxID=2657482 RepID=UPI003CFAF9EF
MYDPNSAIPEDAKPELWRRYDQWRGDRHRRFAQRTAHQLTRWRNRRGYRTVVVAQAVCILILLAGAVVSFVSPTWFLLPFLVGVAGSLVCQRTLRIITGSIGDAPVTALDEIQLAQRNSARSLAFIVLFTLMFVPYIALIVLSIPDHVPGQVIYGLGMLTISLMLAAAVLPSMLTAWWMADPDPEDFADEFGHDPTTPTPPITPTHTDPRGERR